MVGIDLGTTFSEIGFLDDTGVPKVIPNLDGELKTPSVVHYAPTDREPTVGTAALNMQMADPQHTMIQPKRDVGTDKVYFMRGGTSVTPELCQTKIISYLRKSLMEQSGDDQAASQGVITVPAYFGEKERQSVKRSAEQAGLEPLALINEPTAAALAYGLNNMQRDQTFVVSDIGGGTFDVSIVHIEAGEVVVQATHGDKFLGGCDADNALMTVVQSAFKKEHKLDFSLESHPADWFIVREEIVRQKHMLSSRKEVKICARVDGAQVLIPLSREQFAELIRPLMDRAQAVVLEALKGASMDRSEVKEVWLVGGSSRLLPFQDMHKALFGPDCIMPGKVSPDLAVVEGAVIYATRLVSTSGTRLVNTQLQAIPAPAITHVDVMPLCLGVSVQDRVSQACRCAVILQKNLPLPCTATQKYGSVTDDQTLFRIVILQGNDGQPIAECLVVAERELRLPPRSSAEPSIEVTMGYDRSGMVHVEVKDLVSGKVEDITVDFFAAKAAATNERRAA